MSGFHNIIIIFHVKNLILDDFRKEKPENYCLYVDIWCCYIKERKIKDRVNDRV